MWSFLLWWPPVNKGAAESSFGPCYGAYHVMQAVYSSIKMDIDKDTIDFQPGSVDLYSLTVTVATVTICDIWCALWIFVIDY